MNRLEIINNPDRSAWFSLLKRPTIDSSDLSQIVNEVFSEVSKFKDEAIKKFTRAYDKVALADLTVNQDEFEAANMLVSIELKKSINLAANNIELFHKAESWADYKVETMPGVTCWKKQKSIGSVGLYIPGGTAPLFSTVLMLGIPARLAGCREIVLCTPPNSEGKIAPEILYAATLVGITTILKVGGIQAIAGMTIGTDSIPKVDKIFGPGNQYVTAAKKRAVDFGVAIEMPAGPSELMVLADDTAIPSFVAADLLSQAEHGVDSQVVLVASNETFVESVITEINIQLKGLSRRDIAAASLENARFLVVNDKSETVEIVNEYAPEHLIIASQDEEYYLQMVRNAGSVFLGNFSPESAGDYASGTNHTLPTNGYAKSYSGVGVSTFCKTITYQRIDRSGVAGIGRAVELMAEAEGLDAHKYAMSLRIKSTEH